MKETLEDSLGNFTDQSWTLQWVKFSEQGMGYSVQ